MKIKTFMTVTGFAIILLTSPVIAGKLADAVATIAHREYTNTNELFRPVGDDSEDEARYYSGPKFCLDWGLPKDYRESAKGYFEAAEQGKAEAQDILGTLYLNGCGVRRNVAEAVKWYSKAIDQGYAKAQFNLGRAYRNGRGVPQDNDKAVKLIRLAADQDYAIAQFFLATMYHGGGGVPENPIQAYLWYTLAATSFQASDSDRHQMAINFRNSLAKEMSPTQIADAERLVQEWATAHPKK